METNIARWRAFAKVVVKEVATQPPHKVAPEVAPHKKKLAKN